VPQERGAEYDQEHRRRRRRREGVEVAPQPGSFDRQTVVDGVALVDRLIDQLLDEMR
jgi:hypothetical protein